MSRALDLAAADLLRLRMAKGLGEALNEALAAFLHDRYLLGQAWGARAWSSYGTAS